jgi:outer membrane protein OmpA-like peptidoglycan-associated protein
MKLTTGVLCGLVLLAVLVVGAVPLQAQAVKPDKAGCTDSPLLSRVSGCHIYDCDRSDWDAVKLPVGVEGTAQTIEGEKVHIYYECAGENYSRTKVVRNAEAALRPAGYAIEFSGMWDGDPAVTARKGPQWVFVYTGSDRYWVTTVKVEEMAQEMVATAAVMADGISTMGHFAVYGIYFDTDKAVIKPESGPALAEMAKLLKDNPSLNVFIVGHTDSTGAFEHNMTLSMDRATAVVNALINGHGIAVARLKAVGDGPTAPVESNDTDEGRAKNRRVEMVKR